jgi:hypothetical protein
MSTKLYWPIMSSIKIGTVTAILYLGVEMNFMWVIFSRVLHINATDHLIVLWKLAQGKPCCT